LDGWRPEAQPYVSTRIALDVDVVVEGQLLREHLTPFQMSEMERTGWVPVVGSQGGRYSVGIWPDRFTANVYRLVNDTKARPYCLVVYGVSRLDAAIAKILLLEADERLFLQKAT